MAVPWLPAPRLSSLVYRSNSGVHEGNSDSRPHPSAQDKVIASQFETLNAVGDGCCWMTGVGDAERVPILPHVEKDCTRLILWLQLMELVPMTIHERAKWKVSHENLLPLQHSIHRHLTDGDQRRAVLRPTRKDLLLLVQVLEEGLQKEDEQDFNSAWRPRWDEMIQAGWPRKKSFGTLCLPSYEFQLDIFNLKPLTIFKVRQPAGLVSRVKGDESYPNVLEPHLDNVQAPLSILAVVAVAVSQASYISRSAGRKYEAAFLEELEIMSHVVNLLGSPTPSYFRRLQRPCALPPLPPLPQSASSSSPERMREWPGSDLSSISMLSPPPGLQDAKDATAKSTVEEQAQGQGLLEPSLAAGRGSGSSSDSVASSVALWHEEAQSLDDEQDLLLDNVVSALAGQMQALSNDADSTSTPLHLFDFLVSAEPLDITSKLQAIEQRREEMLEQWEDGLG